MFLEIKGMKGFRHISSKTVYKRIEVLGQEGWIAQKGKRRAKVQGDALLYEIALKGKAALQLNKKDIEEFLNMATNEQLARLVDLFKS